MPISPLNIKRDVKEPVIQKTKKELRAEFAEIMGAYAIQNPVKYAIKKSALEKKLATFDEPKVIERPVESETPEEPTAEPKIGRPKAPKEVK